MRLYRLSLAVIAFSFSSILWAGPFGGGSFSGGTSGSSSSSGGSSGSGFDPSTNINFTGVDTFNSSTTFNGTLKISSGVVANGSAGTAGYPLTSNGAGSVPTWTIPSFNGIKLYDSTLLADGSFTVTGISPSYDSLKIIAFLRVNTTNNTALFKFNNSSSNFVSSILSIHNNASGVTPFTDGTFAFVAYNGTDINSFTVLSISIPNYSSTSVYKDVFVQFGSHYDGTSFSGLTGMYWNNTSAISRIDIYAASSDLFIAGSRLIIYGVTY